MALRDLAVGALTFLLPLVLFVASPTHNELGRAAGYSYDRPLAVLWGKLRVLWETIFFGYWPIDLLTLVFAAFAGIMLQLHGRVRLERSMLLPLGLLCVSFLMLPWKALGGAFLDTRIPIAILLVLLSSLDVVWRTRRWGHLAFVGMLVFLIARSGVLINQWKDYGETTREFTEVVSKLPGESVLFVASRKGPQHAFAMAKRQRPRWHMANLAVLHGSVFVPSIVTYLSQQPLSVASRFASAKDLQGNDPIGISGEEQFAELLLSIRCVASGVGMRPGTVFILVFYPQGLTSEYAQIWAEEQEYTIYSINSLGTAAGECPTQLSR